MLAAVQQRKGYQYDTYLTERFLVASFVLAQSYKNVLSGNYTSAKSLNTLRLHIFRGLAVKLKMM